jgi:hypothetical protein
MKYQIEKDIPMYTQEYPFTEMQEGDSFFVPCSGKEKARKGLLLRIRQKINWYLRDLQCSWDDKPIFKAFPYPLEKPTGIRVWRLPKKEQ